MHYVIDPITCPDKAHFVRDWHNRRVRLEGCQGFAGVELFERQRSLRDASYDFVVLQSWHSSADYHNVRNSGLLAPTDDGGTGQETSCRLEIHLGEPAAEKTGNVWLVNPFEIGEDEMASVLDMWEKAKDYMVHKPGFINARLFRTAVPGSRYGLFNISQWQNEDLFMAAVENKDYDAHRAKSYAYNMHPSLCTRPLCFLGQGQGLRLAS